MRHFKIVLTFILVILICHVEATSQNDTFKISGKISGINSGNISLRIPSGDKYFKVQNNNVLIDNGSFEISGTLSYPVATMIMVSDNDLTYFSNWFYIENSEQEIDLKIIDNTVIVESNSTIFIEYKNTFGKFIDSIMNIKIIAYEGRNSLDKDNINYQNKSDSIDAVISNLDIVFDSFLLEQIKLNNKSYLALSELYSVIEFNKNQYFEYFELFAPELKISILGIKVKDKLNKYNYLKKGSLFPSLTLLDINFHTETIQISSVNQYTLVDFWFSSCGACIIQFPKLKELYSKYNIAGFEIIGISTELTKTKSEWRKAIDKYQLPWHQLWDKDHLQASEYGIKTYPTNFLLDNNGVIIERNIDVDELSIFLNTNLH